MEPGITACQKDVGIAPFPESVPMKLSCKYAKAALNEKHQSHRQPVDFLRWRPSFHLIAPDGWMNDPCAPGYDPSTGLYHLAFQWNPNGNDWGNISWGHSTSRDLVSWDTSRIPVLKPSVDYDRCGIFTGSFQPTNGKGVHDGTLSYIYTSVSQLPVHYTLPYVTGSETISIATSHDGGETWKRSLNNPILCGPPSGLAVTAWRDPFISRWPAMKKAQHMDEDVVYGFVSGGITNQTPTAFVYSISAHDLTNWTYMGYLLDMGLNFRPSRWSGDFGINWEVVNLLTLNDERGASKDFVIMGAEGCKLRDDLGNCNEEPLHARPRIPRSQLWMLGEIQHKDIPNVSSPLMKYGFGGIFDHGCFYAANSFWDPVVRRHVVYGWITEDDLPNDLRHRQNWSGLLSIPRAVRLGCMHAVTRARSSAFRLITSIEVEPDGQGTYTVRTLCVVPDPRVERLRIKARKSELSNVELHSSAPHGTGTLRLQTVHWEIDSEFAVSNGCRRVGIVIGHSKGFATQTVLAWEPGNETFLIRRPNSPSIDPRINHASELAPHTLFSYRDKTGEEVEEKLRIQAFYDNSVLEVFVNERTTISTRIYLPESVCVGVTFFAEPYGCTEGDSFPAAVLHRGTVWDGLLSV